MPLTLACTPICTRARVLFSAGMIKIAGPPFFREPFYPLGVVSHAFRGRRGIRGMRLHTSPSRILSARVLLQVLFVFCGSLSYRGRASRTCRAQGHFAYKALKSRDTSRIMIRHYRIRTLSLQCAHGRHLLRRRVGSWCVDMCADAGWAIGRHPNGTAMYDPELFPDGIKPVADYVHSRSGLEAVLGTRQCPLCALYNVMYPALPCRQGLLHTLLVSTLCCVLWHCARDGMPGC